MPLPTDPKVKRQTAWNSFVILPENRSAVRAVRGLTGAILAGKRSPVCPLVLHGPPGTGKTRLASAALATLTGKTGEHNDLTVRCVSAGELARPDQRDQNDGFADRGLQTCDFLIVEDLQHLTNRAADAACDLIDLRSARRKPLVITTSSGPAGLTHLSRRLTSRLAAGLVVQLQPLGIASRQIILAALAQANGLRLTPEALFGLARRSDGMRAALGSLQNLTQLTGNYSGPLDGQAVTQILAGTGLPAATHGHPGPIIKRVAALFAINEQDLLGPSRFRRVLLPRQVAMYLTRALTKLSLPQIGAVFAGRDHTTVLHACRKVEAELKTNDTLVMIVKQVKRELG